MKVLFPVPLPPLIMKQRSIVSGEKIRSNQQTNPSALFAAAKYFFIIYGPFLSGNQKITAEFPASGVPERFLLCCHFMLLIGFVTIF